MATNGTTSPGHRANGVDTPNSFLDDNTEEEARMLEAMDRLRQAGVDSIDRRYNSPQLVVCGAQSAGKSSVLEAITGIPFPTGTGMCTRYVTRVTLVRGPEAWIKVKISPDRARERSERHALRSFAGFSMEGHVDHRPLPELLESARRLIFQGSAADKLITLDVLDITKSSPTARPLQLLDLPGLTDYMPQEEGAEARPDVGPEIEQLVRKHIAMPQAIMLAVIKATNDVQNNKILKFCEDVDPQGVRTIGVITQPDLASRTQREYFIPIVNGRDPRFRFNYLWFVLRNRDADEVAANTTSMQRDEAEERYFREGPWNEARPDRRGIEALRLHIRTQLFSAAQRELPLLYQAMDDQLLEFLQALTDLGGEPLSDAELARIYGTVCRRLAVGARDHARGIYGSNTRKFPDDSVIHLRARVAEQDEVFRDTINDAGHAWSGTDSGKGGDESSGAMSLFRLGAEEMKAAMEEMGIAKPGSRDELAMALAKLHKKRGQHLPGFYDPARINDVFWDLSEPWKAIAQRYVDKIHECCKEYFRGWTPVAFARSSDLDCAANGFGNCETVSARFICTHIIPKLDDCRTKARRELVKLEADRLMAAKNLDPEFIRILRDYRGEVAKTERDEKDGPFDAVAGSYVVAAWTHYVVSEALATAALKLPSPLRH